MKNIFIIGSGFGGIRCALDLSRKKIPDVTITLISRNAYFEYLPALYHIVVGGSSEGISIPLGEIFKQKNITFIEDTIVSGDLAKKKICGEQRSSYLYDFLVLAVGCETSYFSIPGLKQFSHGCKSLSEAARLNRHLHDVISNCSGKPKEETVCAAHIVIVGGGPTGVELAGELGTYVRCLTKKYRVDPSLVTIELIEMASRLLPNLPEDISQRTYHRLHSLGVNIFLNRTLVKEEIDTIYLKEMEMKTMTVIWTAGIKPNTLVPRLKGAATNEKGYVIVDDCLRIKGFQNAFALGDIACMPYAGMAQTALHQGRFVASALYDIISKKELRIYRPKKPIYVIPVGKNWATVLLGTVRIYGIIGWFIKYLADLKFYFSILPFRRAIKLARKKIPRDCEISQR